MNEVSDVSQSGRPSVCRGCGAIVAADVKECPQCGAGLAAASRAAEARPDVVERAPDPATLRFARALFSRPATFTLLFIVANVLMNATHPGIVSTKMSIEDIHLSWCDGATANRPHFKLQTNSFVFMPVEKNTKEQHSDLGTRRACRAFVSTFSRDHAEEGVEPIAQAQHRA